MESFRYLTLQPLNNSSIKQLSTEFWFVLCIFLCATVYAYDKVFSHFPNLDLEDGPGLNKSDFGLSLRTPTCPGSLCQSLRLGLLMWHPSDVTHPTSSEDPGSLQAAVEGASQVPVSREARWEVLLLCWPSSGMSVPAATVT